MNPQQQQVLFAQTTDQQWGATTNSTHDQDVQVINNHLFPSCYPNFVEVSNEDFFDIEDEIEGYDQQLLLVDNDQDSTNTTLVSSTPTPPRRHSSSCFPPISYYPDAIVTQTESPPAPLLSNYILPSFKKHPLPKANDQSSSCDSYDYEGGVHDPTIMMGGHSPCSNNKNFFLEPTPIGPPSVINIINAKTSILPLPKDTNLRAFCDLVSGSVSTIDGSSTYTTTSTRQMMVEEYGGRNHPQQEEEDKEIKEPRMKEDMQLLFMHSAMIPAEDQQDENNGLFLGDGLKVVPPAVRCSTISTSATSASTITDKKVDDGPNNGSPAIGTNCFSCLSNNKKPDPPRIQVSHDYRLFPTPPRSDNHTTTTSMRKILCDDHVDVGEVDNLWMRRYMQLCEYKARNGHCRVPYAYPPNPSLGEWVKRQRYHYKLMNLGKKVTSMNMKRAEMLNNIGFVWSSHLASWDERLEELREFQKKHNHCQVPSIYRPNQKLANWFKRQKRERKLFLAGKKSAMTEGRMKELAEFDF